MNELTYHLSTIEQVEKMILIKIIGVMECLEKELIVIEEAEKILFSPYSMEFLKKKGINKEIIEIIHLGTELEDVESLIPEKLSCSFKEIRIQCENLLKRRKDILINENTLI